MVGRMAVADARTAYRTCPLCEATCGLELTFDGEQLTGIRGDGEDVFSHGFICPKGSALRALHEDPDRVTTPLIREGDGFREAGWDEAFALIAQRLGPILDEDRNGVGVYLGNPNAHNLSNLLYTRALNRALCTRNIYSASTVDQFPKQMASALMFGTGTSVAVPDIDRTDHLLILGANPLASNGSLMTAPDMRGRLRALRGRGGKIVVVDPRRTRTAQEADEHHFIRPGTDALLLFALVAVLFSEDLADPGERIAELCTGLDEVRALAEPFTPEAVAGACGIEAGEIRRMARELAAAPTAAVYGRIGTCTQEFGTLASWLVDVLNVLTGNLDSPRWRHVPPGRRRRGERRRRTRSWPGRAVRALRQPGPRPRRAVRGTARGLPRRGDRHPRRGPDPRADHHFGQPGPLDPQQRPARRGAARDRLHGLARRVPQRDHSPRRRHPPRPLPPAPRPL